MRPARVTRRPARRRGLRLRKPGRLLILLVLLALMAGCTYWGIHGIGAMVSAAIEAPPSVAATDGADTVAVSATAAVLKTPPEHVNWVLLVGVDGDQGQADAIVLARIDRNLQTVHLLSLPRETRVNLAGHGAGSLGMAHAFGGMELTRQAVESLLGETVKYYVKINLEGFRRLMDLLGGVTLAVDRPMHYHSTMDGVEIDLEPGVQKLEGDQALDFLRFRLSDDGHHDDELTRAARHQLFLKVLAQQVLTPSSLVKVPELLTQAAAYVETDIPPAEQLTLAQVVYSAREHVQGATAPGDTGTDLTGSYFLINRGKLDRLLSSWSD